MRMLPVPAAVVCLLGLTLAGHTLAGEVPADWAYKPVTAPTIPATKGNTRARNPVDAFLLARLEPRGVAFAPAADRRTLIRRLTFDLTGLPPTPEAVDAFLQDNAPDATARLVDRLLASPQYGERQALFWLDLVRYAESDGFKADDGCPDEDQDKDGIPDRYDLCPLIPDDLAGLPDGCPEGQAPTAAPSKK